jgi:hypothetical protein
MKSKVEVITNTLMERFGYGKREAVNLAKQIDLNLRNYLKIQELMMKRKAK